LNTGKCVEIFSPEFLLAAACCRWPPSPSRTAAVRDAAARVTDWNEFLRLVNRQRIPGLVQEALSVPGIELPPPVAQKLTSQAEGITRQNLNFTAETLRLQSTFEEANIPALALKGVALAQLAYGSLGIKHARDIDFLVPANKVVAALELLERHGYEPSSPTHSLTEKQQKILLRYGREIELLHRSRKVQLELHWHAAANSLLLQGVDANSVAQSVGLGNGVSVRTLAPDDLFAYLCVHGARHAWSRLKWLADVNALLSARDTDIARLYHHAQWVGAGLCAGHALLLCQQLFALRLPEDIAVEIRSDERATRLVAIAVGALTAPNSGSQEDNGLIGVLNGVRAQFLLGRGWSFFMEQCRVESVNVLDVVGLPLPPIFQFLYPILRLPLWLWRRAIWAFKTQKTR
jgi:Uncharacterised nucleotidyltransferase